VREEVGHRGRDPVDLVPVQTLLREGLGSDKLQFIRERASFKVPEVVSSVLESEQEITEHVQSSFMEKSIYGVLAEFRSQELYFRVISLSSFAGNFHLESWEPNSMSFIKFEVIFDKELVHVESPQEDVSLEIIVVIVCLPVGNIVLKVIFIFCHFSLGSYIFQKRCLLPPFFVSHDKYFIRFDVINELFSSQSQKRRFIS